MVQSVHGDANQELTRPEETGAIMASVRSHGNAAGMGAQSTELAALAHFAPSPLISPDRLGDQGGLGGWMIRLGRFFYRRVGNGPEAAMAWTSPPGVRAGHGHQPNASPPQPATDSSDSVPRETRAGISDESAAGQKEKIGASSPGSSSVETCAGADGGCQCPEAGRSFCRSPCVRIV